MSTIDDNPPVSRGPFVTPWPGRQTDLPPLPSRQPGGGGAGGVGDVLPTGRAGPQMPVQASGGVALPSDVVPTVEFARLAVANGTKVFPVNNGSSTPILTKPPNIRNFLYLRNSSVTANLYIEFGGVASTSSAVRLEPNEQLILDAVVLQDDITAYADAANGQLSLMFSNIALPPGYALP